MSETELQSRLWYCKAQSLPHSSTWGTWPCWSFLMWSPGVRALKALKWDCSGFSVWSESNTGFLSQVPCSGCQTRQANLSPGSVQPKPSAFSHIFPPSPTRFRLWVFLGCGKSLPTAPSLIHLHIPAGSQLWPQCFLLRNQSCLTSYKTADCSTWHLKHFTLNPNLPRSSYIKMLPLKFLKGERIWIDSSKEGMQMLICTWKSSDHHRSSGKCQSKPQWDIISHLLGKLSSKTQEILISVGEDVEKLEPLYTELAFRITHRN